MKKAAVYFASMLLLALEGCMMPAMHMLGTDHHSNNSQINSKKIISKEIIISNYKIEIEFPISQLHQEINYLLQIYDQNTKNKIANAEVWFEVIRRNQNDSDEIEKLVSKKIEADDNRNFISSYIFHSDEEVQVGFKVYSIENEKFDKPIEIFSNQGAAESHSNHQSESGINPLWYIGAAAMAVMMLIIHL